MRRFVNSLIFVQFILLFVACTPDVRDTITAVPERTQIPKTATPLPTVESFLMETAVVPTNPPPPTSTHIASIIESVATKPQEIPISISQDVVSEYLRGIYKTEAGWVSRKIDMNMPYISNYVPEMGELLYHYFGDEGTINSFNFDTGETKTWTLQDGRQGTLIPNQDAFAYVDAQHAQLHLLDRATGHSQVLANHVFENISASPDGTKIAFERSDGNRGFIILDLDTNLEIKLWETPREEDSYGDVKPVYETIPIWSPTSKQLLVSSAQDGVIWGGGDGSFVHAFSYQRLEEQLNENAVKDRNRTLCLVREPLLFDNMMVDMVAPCHVEYSYMNQMNYFRERTHLAIFHLNPENGEIEQVDTILYHGRYKLATWDVPGDSVLLLHEDDRVESFALDLQYAPNADYITCQPIMMTQGHYHPNPLFVYEGNGNVYGGVHGGNDPKQDEPLLDYGDVTSIKRSDEYELVFIREPNEGVVELWWRDFNFENHQFASFSIPDYLAAAPDGVVDATFAYEWLPDSNKLLAQFVPQLDAIGRLPIQRPIIFDVENQQELDLTAYGDIYQVAFVDGGYLVALVQNQQLSVVHVDSKQIEQQIQMDTTDAYDQTVSFSPNGRFLAAFEPDGLLIVDRMTTQIKRVPLLFTDVGLGHYSAWPTIHWLNDGKTIRTMLSENEDVFSPSATFSVWDIDAETAVVTPRQTYNGNVVTAEFAPDANYMAYVAHNSETGNSQRLMIANIYKGTETEYAVGESMRFGGWNPNGVLFTYKMEGAILQLGHICQDPQPLFDTSEILWLDEDFYLVATDQDPEYTRGGEIWSIGVFSLPREQNN